MSCIEILESSDISSRPFNDRFHDVMRFFQLWYRIKNDFYLDTSMILVKPIILND